MYSYSHIITDPAYPLKYVRYFHNNKYPNARQCQNYNSNSNLFLLMNIELHDIK